MESGYNIEKRNNTYCVVGYGDIFPFDTQEDAERFLKKARRYEIIDTGGNETKNSNSIQKGVFKDEC